MSLTLLNPLKCGELVQDLWRFIGNSEQFSYSPTIVDTHVCTFFDGVLEKVLERIFDVRHRKTLETEYFANQNQEEKTTGVKNRTNICSL